LVIDADGVLAFAVALERFEAIAGRDGEEVEFGDGVDLGEFPQGDALDVRRERPGFPFFEEEGGLPACERTNHRLRALVTRRVKLSRWRFLSPTEWRATIYRAKGAAVTDLAEPLLENDGERVGTSGTSSPHNGPTSPNNETGSPHLVDETCEEWLELMAQAQQVRTRQRIPPEDTKELILSLCARHFLTAEQFSKLLGRNPQGLRDRFLTPLLRTSHLEHRFPATPNHEQQAYRRKG
jgi:hypothetical protein